MPILKNVRHEQFARAFAICGNAAESWRRAGGRGKNADVHGPAWMGKNGIAERIEELRRQAADESDLSRRDLTGWLSRVINGRVKVSPEQLRAAEILGRMCGWSTVEKVETSITVRLTRAWVE